MEQIKSKIEKLANRINAPKEYLPTYGFTEDFAGPHIEVNGKKLHWVIIERGQELARRQTTDEKEFLFWVFDAVTFEMATRLELQNRNENEDFRIQLFKIQEELIGEIDSDYSDRLNIKHRKLLKI
ncbi:immunity 63 family protein [Algoriphagus halophytocola]|uniref:Immunity 63 family protein n=1 Tax=Algoriphagus halophytocola TaxID=2991499 RepID=A0ABY6MHE9_9BACT|nr:MULTISPECIES: immunity 63 family protein [unclassified Algoriphagus]UZD23207.1 immunity 63 family protein [Algoriphagus sp. TR-M5]WBL44500.1 immunity 63 family protein [Algoriphagus sp. TR-M9]